VPYSLTFFNFFDEQMFVENYYKLKLEVWGSVLLLVNKRMIDWESALVVLLVYDVVQHTVRANQTHLGLPTSALEIALLMVVASSLE